MDTYTVRVNFLSDSYAAFVKTVRATSLDEAIQKAIKQIPGLDEADYQPGTGLSRLTRKGQPSCLIEATLATI